LRVGDPIEVGVSDPAEFFLEAGDGPYPATIESIEENEVGLKFNRPLKFRNCELTHSVAVPRHTGNNFANWNGSAISVNLSLSVKISGLTHLIGGISRAL